MRATLAFNGLMTIDRHSDVKEVYGFDDVISFSVVTIINPLVPGAH